VVGIRKLGTACLACALSGGIALGAGEEERAADHAALRALREKVTAALNTQDVPALTSFLARKFTMTTVDQSTATRPEWPEVEGSRASMAFTAALTKPSNSFSMSSFSFRISWVRSWTISSSRFW